MRIPRQTLKQVPIGLAPDASFQCFERVEPEFPIAWHYHPEVELTLIVSGSGLRLVGDNLSAYEPGDLVLLGPGLPQTWMSEKPGDDGLCRAVVVQFAMESPLGTLIQTAPEFAPVRRMIERCRRGLHFPANPGTRKIIDQFRALPGQSAPARFGGLCAILGALAERPSSVISSERSKDLTAPDSAVLDRVLRYAQAGGREITLAQAARMAAMTRPAFCRWFKRAMGRTFTEHVNDWRLSRAARMLIEDSLPVAEVGLRAGYSNLSYFHRLFRKRYGVTALGYRKKHG